MFCPCVALSPRKEHTDEQRVAWVPAVTGVLSLCKGAPTEGSGPQVVGRLRRKHLEWATLELEDGKTVFRVPL